MKNHAIIFGLLLATCGCETPISMAIDSKFSDEESDLIEHCMREWLVATDSEDALLFSSRSVAFNHPFNMSDWNGDWEFAVIFKAHSSDPGYEGVGDILDSDSWAGAHNELNHNLAVVEEHIPDERTFRQTVLHELGHFYGLGHEDEGLMYEVNSGGPGKGACIDEYTLELFCDKHECGSGARSTCDPEDFATEEESQ